MFDLLNRFILSPDNLYQTRRSTQCNELKRSFQDALGTSERNVRSKETTIQKLNDSADMDMFLKDVIMNNKEKKGSTSIIGLKLNEESDKEKVEIILAVKSIDCEEGKTLKYEKIVELPLVPFANKLADTFENHLTSTTLCFVADASSGLGSEILGRIASSTGAGLALIKEPIWMSMLAHFISQKLLSQSDLKNVMFGLCRLNAWEIREQVGENRTVVFTLPGQNCTANLLPSLQAAFPCERHIFIYDGCIDSTARGMRLLRANNNIQNVTNNDNCMPRKISTNIPISQLSAVSNIAELLSSLQFHQAGIVECWLSSVDAFLQLKHTEKKTSYTPFVCRLGFLLSKVGKLGNGKVDQSELALTNILQFITGSKSRALKSGVLEEAREILNEIRDIDKNEGERYRGIISESEKEVIEACVFSHKGILIENKTLMDTVQPQVEWSLKAAKKLTSCACCMPGLGDDEEDEEDEVGDSNGKSEKKSSNEEISEKMSQSIFKAPIYLDGKSTFAFDPTRFS